MPTITFKKQPKEKGLASVGSPNQSIDCKINKKTFGMICAPNWQTKDNKWSVGIMIIKPAVDNNPNCNWKWIHFTKSFDEPEQAKIWLQENIDKITAKYKLRFSE